MVHLYSEEQRIQDPAKVIPDDEPVFLLRASDPGCSDALRCLADIYDAYGSTSGDDLRGHADAMDVWAAKSEKKVRGGFG